jgi:hypothetical protein
MTDYQNEKISEILTGYGLGQNEANGANTLKDIQTRLKNIESAFFGLYRTLQDSNTTRAVNFIREGLGIIEFTTMQVEKPTLLERAALVFLYDYADSIHLAGGQVVAKDVTNSVQANGWVKRNEYAQDHADKHDLLKNLCRMTGSKVHAECEILDDQIYFVSAQNLKVGDSVIVNGVDCTILDETELGHEYTVDSNFAETVGFAEYDLDMTIISKFPTLIHVDLKQFIS